MSGRLVPISVDARTAPIITLQRPVLLIGRHPECDVRIDLPQISRRHCCVGIAYERVVIRDLGSRNGLRLNGLPVEEAQLKAGDEIAIGHVIYRCEGAPPPANDVTPVIRSSGKPSPPKPPADEDIELVPLDDL